MVAEQSLLVLLAGILGYAVVTDMAWHKVPNGLSLGGCLVGILYHVLMGGVDGLLFGVGGSVTGLLVYLPLYLYASMGAGDVKLMCAVGAFVGPAVVVCVALVSVIVGGIFGVALITAAGELPKFLGRNARLLRHLVMTGTINYEPPAPGDAAGQRMPFAPAIALGTLATLWYLDRLGGLLRLA